MRAWIFATGLLAVTAAASGEDRFFFTSGHQHDSRQFIPTAERDWKELPESIDKRPPTLGNRLETWARECERIANKAIAPNASSAEQTAEFQNLSLALGNVAQEIAAQPVEARLTVDDVIDAPGENGTSRVVIGHIKADHTPYTGDEQKILAKYSKMPTEKAARDAAERRLADAKRVFASRRSEHLVFIPTSDPGILGWRKGEVHAVNAVIQRVGLLARRSRVGDDFGLTVIKSNAGLNDHEWNDPAFFTIQVVVKPVALTASVAKAGEKPSTQPVVER